MRRTLLIVAVAFSLATPAVSFAMQSQTLSFAEGTINARWIGQGDISMQQAKNGIVLQTGSRTGMLLTQLSDDFHPEFGVIHTSSAKPSRFYFAWIFDHDPTHETYTIPFGLMTGDLEEKDFSLRGKEEWNIGEKKIGIVLPPNTRISLQNITLHRSNIFDEAVSILKSFWVFDEQRPYSINFVWGPQIGLNSAETSHLYDYLPPPYFSGTLALNLCLFIILLSLIGIGIWKKNTKQQILLHCVILFGSSWFLFDLRMGSEFLSWVIRDNKTYIAAEPAQRIFRDRERFYDFAEFAKPLLNNRFSYVFFAPRPWPYLGNMRYLTYPAIPGIDYKNNDTWVIYNRPDMSIDTEGHLTVDSVAVTPPGTLLGRFDDTSFIYRITQ